MAYEGPAPAWKTRSNRWRRPGAAGARDRWLRAAAPGVRRRRRWRAPLSVFPPLPSTGAAAERGSCAPTRAAGEGIAMAESVSDAELVERFPWVQLSHENKHLFRGWLERRLQLNRCLDCGRFHHPPKPICPECWSSRVEPTEVSGRGV